MVDVMAMSEIQQEEYAEDLSDLIFTRVQLVVQGVVPFVPVVVQGQYPYGEYEKLDPTHGVEFENLEEVVDGWAAGLGFDIDDLTGVLPYTRTAYGEWLDRRTHREFFVRYYTEKLEYCRMHPEWVAGSAGYMENAVAKLVEAHGKLADFLETDS